MKSTPSSFLRGAVSVAAGLVLSTQAVFAASGSPFKVLWWDSTPEYGSQAPDALRQEFATYLTSYAGGSVFNATYVSSETAGTFASHMASNSYDVIVFDATSYSAKFNSADLDAVKSFYSAGKKNLVLDGTLYIRSINYNTTSDFPGVNSATGGLTVNEVYSLASRGGGIMIGTDHSGYQVDANQVLQAILPSATFSGVTYPSTDGLFYGNDLLNAKQPIAAVDVFNHWDSIDTQAIAPTGAYNDFSGAGLTLYSQVDVANAPGGGTKYSYISTSWKPGSGSTVVTDPNEGGSSGGGDNGGGSNRVPDASSSLALFAAACAGFALLRRRVAA